MKGIIGKLGIIVFIVFLIGLNIKQKNEVLVLEQQLSEVENNYQIFRSAAQDAYGWAVGYDSGEQIPGEFFDRYLDNNLSQEEFDQKYADAKIIVGERLRIQGK